MAIEKTRWDLKMTYRLPQKGWVMHWPFVTGVSGTVRDSENLLAT